MELSATTRVDLGRPLTIDAAPSASAKAAGDPASLLRLPDHRYLSYTVYGEPVGIPVVYFHDCGSSRLEGSFFDAAARRQGIRLIAVDRPGIGGTDYKPNSTPLDFCRDVLHLANELGCSTLSVMSLGAGGIYSLTLAHYFPERVERQVNLGGLPGAVFNEPSLRSLRSTCLQGLMPWLIRHLVRCKHQFFPENPQQNLARLQSFLDYTDRKILQDPELLARFARDQQEALQQGSLGIAQDAALCYRKLEFMLREVPTPTVIWQGAADRLSQRADSAYMAARMPDARVVVVPNRGHFFFLHSMDQILASVIGERRTRVPLAA